MKKLILLTFVTVLASCTSNPTTEVTVKTDSLTTTVDTLTVGTADSIAVDTVAVDTAIVK